MPPNEFVHLKPHRERHASQNLDFVREEFPDAWARIPAGLPLFPGGFRLADGTCSHPEHVRESWLFRAADFTTEVVPDGFFLAGLKNAGGSEHLLLMWREGDRCFWFREQYVSFMWGGDQYTITREALRTALDRWDAGEARVTVGIGSEPAACY